MAQLMPLTAETELQVMKELNSLIEGIGRPDVGARLALLFNQSKKAFRALAERETAFLNIVGFMPRRDVLAQYLPVVNASVLSFNAQCGDIAWPRTPLFDSEIGVDGDRENRFVIRKFPHVAKRFETRHQLIRAVEEMQERNIDANATVWDVLAALRSCRRRLPHKCAIVILHSRIIGKHDFAKSGSPQPPSYMTFFLCGRTVEIRNVSENEYVGPPTLFLDYASSTVDLLA